MMVYVVLLMHLSFIENVFCILVILFLKLFFAILTSGFILN